mmetsp:Transcript_11729/g.23629  ORF Transcript_11729/g.23629 Transcript_11729/m.23629 type:complete len:86 (+) Transcript_11729:3-260(+)
MEKAAVALRLLAHYSRVHSRFFLAVGLGSTHVQGDRICTDAASVNEGGAPLNTSEARHTHEEYTHDVHSPHEYAHARTHSPCTCS